MSRADMRLSFLSAKIHTACVQIFEREINFVGILFLTVSTSVPSQRLVVLLNKSILHDFSDFNSHVVLYSML